MESFNLKKFSEKNHEERLQEQRDTQKTELPLPTGNTDKLLAEKRTEEDPKKPIDAQLQKVREVKPWNSVVEAQLDKQDISDEYPHRTGRDKHDQLPINLLAEAAEKEKLKAYRKASEKKVSSDLADGTGEEGKNAEGDVRSQLHNDADRFKGLTENNAVNNPKVRDMVTASLKDADAMLYYIYHEAASQKRDLTDEEKSLIDGITTDKVHLTSLLYENGTL